MEIRDASDLPDRYVSAWIGDDSDRRVHIIGQAAILERFRPWYERWFTRLDGRWQPRVKWVPTFDGIIRCIEPDPDSVAGFTFTLGQK